MNPLNLLKGYRTYLAAAGFLALAAYYGWEGNATLAMQNLMAALAIFGIRQAVA